MIYVTNNTDAGLHLNLECGVNLKIESGGVFMMDQPLYDKIKSELHEHQRSGFVTVSRNLMLSSLVNGETGEVHQYVDGHEPKHKIIDIIEQGLPVGRKRCKLQPLEEYLKGTG